MIVRYNHPQDYKPQISNTDQESNHKWFGCTLSLTPNLPAILIFVFKQDPFLPSAPFSRKCFLVHWVVLASPQMEVPDGFLCCWPKVYVFGEKQSSWIAIVSHHFGFIESLRYSKLENSVGNFASTKYFKSIDLDSAVPLSLILQCLNHNQTGVVRDGAGVGKTFDIFSGVRQGCVLSPQIFNAAFELAMSERRVANPQGGIHLGDDMLRLPDLRFAGDILIFMNAQEHVQNRLDNSLMPYLAVVGLVLNTSNI